MCCQYTDTFVRRRDFKNGFLLKWTPSTFGCLRGAVSSASFPWFYGPMPRITRLPLCFVSIAFGLVLGTAHAHAHVVITEIFWMGSDLSTADEWVELFNTDEATASLPQSLSGWTLTMLSSAGAEQVMVRFGADEIGRAH